MIPDDELDRQLREAAPYIDDAGFTVRMMKQLPAQRAPIRVRGVILIAATIVASILAYVLSGGARFLTKYAVLLSEAPVTWQFALLFTIGTVIGALGLVAAVFKSREPALLTR